MSELRKGAGGGAARARRKSSTLTPEKALAGVRKISRVNGWSVWVFGLFGTLISLFFGDYLGVSIGVLVVGAGWMEVHGNRRLARRDAKGMNWLVRSQLFLLSVIMVYAVSRLVSYDGELALANLTPDMAAALKELQIKPEDLLPMVQLGVWLGYGAVIVVTGIYQGGLALFYRGRIPLVEKALSRTLVPVSYTHLTLPTKRIV